MLLALSVLIISLYLLSKLRRLQAEMTHLSQIFRSDRDRMMRNIAGVLARLHSAQGSLESASAVQAN